MSQYTVAMLKLIDTVAEMRELQRKKQNGFNVPDKRIRTIEAEVDEIVKFINEDRARPIATQPKLL